MFAKRIRAWVDSIAEAGFPPWGNQPELEVGWFAEEEEIVHDVPDELIASPVAESKQSWKILRMEKT